MSDASKDKVTETVAGQKVTAPTVEEMYGEIDKEVAESPEVAIDDSAVVAQEALEKDKDL